MHVSRLCRSLVAVAAVCAAAGGTRLHAAETAEAATSAATTPGPGEVARLREEVASLRRLVEALQQQVQDIRARSAGAPVDNAAPGGAGQTGSAPPVAAAPGGDAARADLERQLAAELGAGSAAPGTPQTGASQSAAPGSAPAPGPSATTAQADVPSPGWSAASPIPIVSGAGGRNFLNLSLSGLAAGGFSSAQDVDRVQSGGHDPSQRGFTVQNVETVFDGAVDPYFRGQANVVLQLDEHNDTNVELEEAFLVSTSLPHNLQVKGGTFFTEFGRLNVQHPHSWDFVDQPLVNGRFLGGDGLRGPGVRLSWLMPTPFYSELFLTAQNSQGEIAASFRGEEGEEVYGRPLQDRPVRTATDMLFSPRWTASFDLSDTQTVLAGVSAAFGPNAAGGDTSTTITGLDVFWKWKPANAMAGFPFVKWQTEAMTRRYEADAFSRDDDGDGVADLTLRAGTFEDWGAYTQLLWGFRHGWVAGLRSDWVGGTRGPQADLVGDPRRWRLSPNLTWFPTEFSKLRLQYNRDEFGSPGPGESEDSLWMQVEFILGAHAAHKF